MSTEQQILKTLSSIDRRLAKIERASSVKEKEYLTPDEIKIRFNVGPDTLRHMRYEGRLTDYKCSATGRNYKYAIDELEKHFSKKIKLA